MEMTLETFGKDAIKKKNFSDKVWQSGKKQYLCSPFVLQKQTAKRDKSITIIKAESLTERVIND